MRHRPKKRFDHGEPIAKIDTRPLVFVTFFIAIIFLFASNQTRVHALLIELPQGYPPEAPAPYLTVSLNEQGEIRLEDTVVTLEQLTESIIAHDMAQPIVLLRAEPNTAFEIVALVLSKISEANVGPYDICFDPSELENHRQFGKIVYQPSYSLITPDSSNESLRDASISILEPGGCEQFYERLEFF